MDFDEISNDRSAEDNRLRWALLLKGVGSITPGMRYSPTDLALKIKILIETRDQRYALVEAQHQTAPKGRTGMQSYINIVDHYKAHY